MENRQDQGEKQFTSHNKIEEHQNTQKQMLGFDDVNFEQKREPYRETLNRRGYYGESSDRMPNNRE